MLPLSYHANMKTGLESSVGIVEIVVSPEMTAKFNETELHPVYSTFWLAHHAEMASRRAIEPFFDKDEDAVGTAISLEHRAMAGLGATVVITARVEEVRGHFILCSIRAEAKASGTLLAEGTTGQVWMLKSRLLEKISNAAI